MQVVRPDMLQMHACQVGSHHIPQCIAESDNFLSWSCRPYAEKYAESQDAFFEDYTKAHLKLSELGVKWDPEPIEFDT